jgi:hypothetical protein
MKTSSRGDSRSLPALALGAGILNAALTVRTLAGRGGGSGSTFSFPFVADSPWVSMSKSEEDDVRLPRIPLNIVEV